MRKSLFLGLLAQAFCATVFAQSSVTIYGSIDNGITYVNNVAGSYSVRMADGINKANSLGFFGAEDLGGGMKTLFRLENGFSAKTGALGQGGLLFGKQIYVGLSDANVGQVTLGRQYDFTTSLQRYLPCLNCGIYIVQNADLDRASGNRLNNSVQYQSASFGGAKFGAMYAFGENAGTNSTNTGRAVSFSAEYANGPFSGGIVTTDINGAPVFIGVLGAPTVLGTSTATTPAIFVDKQRIVGIGAAYSVTSALRTAAVYTRTRLERGALSNTDQILYLGADYSLTGALKLMGKISHDKFEDSRWNTLNLGLDYSLSKRTDVYVDVGYQRASGTGTRASIALTPGPSSTNSQVLTRVGIRHLF